MLFSSRRASPTWGFYDLLQGRGKGEKVLPYLPFLKFLQFEIVIIPRCTYFQNILNPINYLELSVLRVLRKELNSGELQRWSCNSSLEQTMVLYWQTYLQNKNLQQKCHTQWSHSTCEIYTPAFGKTEHRHFLLCLATLRTLDIKHIQAMKFLHPENITEVILWMKWNHFCKVPSAYKFNKI